MREAATAAPHTRVLGPLSHLAHSARRTPATVAGVGVLWLVGLATGSVVGGPGPRLLDAVAAGVGPLADGRVWTLLTSAAWC